MSKDSLSIVVDKDPIGNVTDYTDSLRYSEYSSRKVSYTGDPFSAVRGIMTGILISIPLWVFIISLILFW